MQGSITNYMMKSSKMPAPEVGMGATGLSYTDRHPFTIVEIVNSKKIVVQEDFAIRTDSNGMSESQSYEYTSNPDAPKIVVTLRKNGHWVQQGGKMSNGRSYLIGHRNKYHDFNF